MPYIQGNVYGILEKNKILFSEKREWHGCGSTILNQLLLILHSPKEIATSLGDTPHVTSSRVVILPSILQELSTWSFNSAVSLAIVPRGQLSPGLFVLPGLHALYRLFLHPQGRDSCLAQKVSSKCVD